MKNIDKLLDELDEVAQQILSGEYDNAEEIRNKYEKIKKEIEDSGHHILDGINFNTILF